MSIEATERNGLVGMPPFRKPRLGFLGLGWIGLLRMSAIAESRQAEIVALADPVESSLLEASKLASDAERLRSLEDLLRLDLDGILIATPSAQHAAQAITALKNGVAVFCQKPLGRDLFEVELILDSAKAANRLLAVDLSYRHTNALKRVREVVQSSELGEIFSAELKFHNGYGPQKPWFYEPQLAGGGCVIDLGIHLVDAALWILGSTVTHTESRLFHRGKRLTHFGEACEDYAIAHIDLASGAVLDIGCSWHLHAGRNAVIRMAFYGAHGAVALENRKGSFFDFVTEKYSRTSSVTLCRPPDGWPGRAAVEWVRRLAQSNAYDPEIEQMITVAKTLDDIYRSAFDRAENRGG